MRGPIFTHNARGHWRVFADFADAIAAERNLAGDRRGKVELWTLFEGVWLYVGPRPRRRGSRHVVQLMTRNGASLIGYVLPPSLLLAPEVNG